MSELVYMITIVDRDSQVDYMSFFNKQGIRLALRATGHGTAGDEVLKYLGLGETEKQILFAAMRGKRSRRILELFASELHLNKPGAGIAFTVPITTVCGSNVINVLSGEESLDEEDTKMKNTPEHELVMVIANRGHIDTIMEAARSTGVNGGTVLHAIGTASEKDAKFFGISIGKEKELIMMVVKEEIKDSAMKAIVEAAGQHTKAKCVVFSIPVSGVAGVN